MRVRGLKTLRLTGRWLRSRLSPGALVLGYHRVANAEADARGLCVSPRHFEEQLEVLRRVACPVALEELVRGLPGDLPRRAVALTFDDGYADVLHRAQPLLERYQIPASVFVVSGCLGGQFPWVEEEPYRQEASPARALSAAELVCLAQKPMIDIGAHTVSHPPLAQLPPAAQETEICESKAVLEALLGRPIRAFSYPHGSFSVLTAGLVERAGYDYACTSFNDVVSGRSSRFLLPRFWPGDWDGDRFGRWLHWWLADYGIF
jgi:peptidoglycan/xylan/chitin deacetylase (PgdA/CDA1 family)